MPRRFTKGVLNAMQQALRLSEEKTGGRCRCVPQHQLLSSGNDVDECVKVFVFDTLCELTERVGKRSQLGGELTFQQSPFRRRPVSCGRVGVEGSSLGAFGAECGYTCTGKQHLSFSVDYSRTVVSSGCRIFVATTWNRDARQVRT